MELVAAVRLPHQGRRFVNATGVKTKQPGLEVLRAGGNTGPACLKKLAWRL